MKIETPVALRFIMQDDIYLLPADKTKLVSKPAELEIETQKIDFNYLGENKKNFLVISYYADQEFIAEGHLAALESILKRKEYFLDDVAILNKFTYPDTDFNDLQAHFNPQKILVLGKNALLANMEVLTLNQPKKIAGAMVLYSFSFDDMMDNTDHKKAFWEQMKTL
jgi:hypothetical protein